MFVPMNTFGPVRIPGTEVALTFSGIIPDKKGFSDKLQLLENQTYEYELDRPGYQIEANGIVFPSQIRRNDNPGSGLIRTGTYVGMLDLRLYKDGEYTGHFFTVEVQSEIINYQRDYRHMLNDITDFIADLQLQLSSPIHLNLKSDIEKQKASPIQKMFFLLGLIQDEKFQQALHMIINRPNSRWSETLVSQDTRKARRFSGSELRQMVSASNRTPVPLQHPLYKRCQTIAGKIETFCLTESTDTVENRFVKYVLSFFASELESFEKEVRKHQSSAHQSILQDAVITKRNLYSFLGRDFFKKVSQLTRIPGNSPLLQRKEGYREILKKWIQYRLGSNISWEGSEDVYRGGQRNLAALYEYWCFFKLLEILQKKFQVGTINKEELIAESSSGFGIKLKAGVELSLSGMYQDVANNRELNIRFSYNRTFSHTENVTDAGSWTLKMRPDYTISFWPSGLPEKEHDRGEQTAEKFKLITHVHFDAKYKAEGIKHILAEIGNDVLNQPNFMDETSDDTTFKRIDILKMHSYRDAIRRTGGAYVLYPGKESKRMHGFHELLPGLGAFSLCPDTSNNGSAHIAQFLSELVELLCDRISQWEQIGYHDYDIHVKGGYISGISIPPTIKIDYPIIKDGNRTAPNQFYDNLKNALLLKIGEDSKNRKKWEKRTEYYNLPPDYEGFEIQHTSNLRYLLQNCGKEIILWEIEKDIAPVFCPRKDLQEKFGYPVQKSGMGHGANGYILYKIKKCDALYGILPNDIYKIIGSQKRIFSVHEILAEYEKIKQAEDNNGN